MGEGTSNGAFAAETLSHLIGMIYDCAVEPRRWAETLAAIREELRFANGMLTVWKVPSGTVLLNVVSGIEQPFSDSLAAYGAEVVEQWGGPQRIAAYPLGEPIVLSRVRRRADWACGRYFREWVEPQGLRDFVALAISREADACCSVGFARHASGGAIRQREIGMLRLLSPHVKRSVAIGRVLEMTAKTAESLSATLDSLPIAIFFVDAGLRVLNANRTARSIVGEGRLVSVRQERLTLDAPESQAALLDAVRPDGRSAGGVLRNVRLRRPAETCQPGILQVLPLRTSSLRPDILRKAAAAVFVAPTERPDAVHAGTAASLFDLTPAEARLLSLLAAGYTVSEAAGILCVKLSTARTHLLHLFAKTNTRRQAELVRLATLLALPLR